MIDHIREIVAAFYMLGSACFFAGTLIQLIWGGK